MSLIFLIDKIFMCKNEMSQELQKCGVSVNILKIVGGGWGRSNDVTTILIYVRLFGLHPKISNL
jgi:hypothetical protein